MTPRSLLPCLLVLGAACGPAPRFATHTCGDGAPSSTRVVHMALTCIEAGDTLADEPDHFAGIKAALTRLAQRTNGRPGETIAGLRHDYARLDDGMRRKYASACQLWTIPCDPSQAAAYHEAVTEIRAGNGRLRDLRAAVEELAGKTGWIEPGDDAARALLRQLEVAAEELDRGPTR